MLAQLVKTFSADSLKTFLSGLPTCLIMEGLAIVSKGLEETASAEIKELVGARCTTESSCVVFNFGKFEDLCLLCYKSQSIDRALLLLGSFTFSDFFAQLEGSIKKAGIGKWVDGKAFSVECLRIGIHDFRSVDVEEKAAPLIAKKCKGSTISLKNSDVKIFFYVNGAKCYFGIDFAGFELNT